MTILTDLQREKVGAGMDHLCQAVRAEYMRTRGNNAIQSCETGSTYRFTDMPSVKIVVTATILEEKKR